MFTAQKCWFLVLCGFNTHLMSLVPELDKMALASMFSHRLLGSVVVAVSLFPVLSRCDLVEPDKQMFL